MEEIIKTLLENVGYSNISLTKPYRFFVGTAEKDNTKYFFKAAEGEDLILQLENESAWNTHILSLNTKTFSVPKRIETIKYKNKNIVILVSEFLDAKPIAALHPERNIVLLEQNIDKIINIFVELNSLESKLLPTENKKFIKLLVGSRFDSCMVYLKDLEDHKLKIETLFKENEFKATLRVRHGDLSPVHFMVNDRKEIFIVDGEHGYLNELPFFDLAHFYHKLFVNFQSPELARDFLKKAFEKITPTKDEMKSFRICLARRIAGGFYEATIDSMVSLEFQEKIFNDLISNSLY